MLQYKSLLPKTLDLLKEVMQIPSLSAYQLVGGTALALQLGHRTSLDLDLFTDTQHFDEQDIDLATVKAEIETQVHTFLRGK